MAIDSSGEAICYIYIYFQAHSKGVSIHEQNTHIQLKTCSNAYSSINNSIERVECSNE